MKVRKSIDIQEVELARARRMADKANLSLNQYLVDAVIAANDGEQTTARIDDATDSLKQTIAQLEGEVSRLRSDLQEETGAVVKAMEAMNQRVIEDNRNLIAKFISLLSDVVPTSAPSGYPSTSHFPAP
ncbi:hypothetical protein [Stenotrophomonas pigmentata]|uniref:hypothetical protein n=1 Tax=Stenotrophomonas pigmentata TaxID=3055080 RepID=UPI0026EB67F7|nr:hypothetical protein [Stenotrophomonas sp. 610A2]